MSRRRGLNVTPSPSRRLSQARSSGVALKLLGKTRPELPTKVASPRLSGPGAQIGGRERRDRRVEPLGGGSVTAEKRLERLGMGEVEAAAAGELKLARRRGRGVVNDDATAALGERFRRRQTGRSGADHNGVDGVRFHHSFQAFTQALQDPRTAAAPASIFILH